MKITSNEMKLILRVAEHRGLRILTVERKSSREFDLRISGTDSQVDNHFGWLVLSAISTADNWTNLAALSDYPEMVATGDWSGIRDSSVESIWNMFESATDNEAAVRPA